MENGKCLNGYLVKWLIVYVLIGLCGYMLIFLLTTHNSLLTANSSVGCTHGYVMSAFQAFMKIFNFHFSLFTFRFSLKATQLHVVE